MGRFSADNSIEFAAFARQGGVCAICGKLLVIDAFEIGHRGAWHAHHIDGDPANNSVENCAAVCINAPERCHLEFAHGGDFANRNYLLPRKYYRFLHQSALRSLFLRLFGV